MKGITSVVGVIVLVLVVVGIVGSAYSFLFSVFSYQTAKTIWVVQSPFNPNIMIIKT